VFKNILISTVAAIAITGCTPTDVPVDPPIEDPVDPDPVEPDPVDPDSVDPVDPDPDPVDPVDPDPDPVDPDPVDPVEPPMPDPRPTVVNVPQPFSAIPASFNRKVENSFVQNANVKDANNLNGAFRVTCGVSYYVRTDPLLNRDTDDPMSHMHTYFGGDVETSDTTDLDDMLAEGTGSTCSGGTINRSLYWIPTMLKDNGNDTYSVVRPSNFLAYYKNSLNVYGKTEPVIFSQNSGINPKTLIRRAMPESLPANWYKLKMISYSYQGNGNVTKGNNTQWECNRQGGGVSKTNGYMPLDCAPGSTLRIQMWFPQCLNTAKQPLSEPESIDSANYTAEGQLSWIRFAENRLNEDGCPSDTAEDTWVRIPTISYTTFYKVGPEGNSNWILSSDFMMGDGRPGNSFHGDFMNGWKPSAANEWYKDCLLNNKSCTNFYDNVGGDRWRKLGGTPF
jgi:hypothetical protein